MTPTAKFMDKSTSLFSFKNNASANIMKHIMKCCYAT